MTTPTPTVPDGLDLGRVLGTYGGPSSAYVQRLTAELAALIPTGDLDARTIERMRRHYQLSACLTVQALPLIRADWAIECDDEDVREYLTSAFERVSFDVLRSSTRALWAGYSPNTLTVDVDPALGGLVFTAVRDLDPATCRPLVDPAGSFAGFQQHPGRAGEQTFDELATLWLVEGMESGNLFGRSLLLAALDPWQDAAAIRVFHARYLERFGEPVVKTRAPAGRTVANADEIEAAVLAGTVPPAPILRDNLETARDIGENLRNHSVVALPGDLAFAGDGKPAGYSWEIDYLESSRNGGADFLEALRELDKRMARAVFIPDLLFSSQDVGAYALGKEHRDVWTLSVEGRLDDYSRQITRQILDRLRLWNFGDRAPRARIVFAPQADEDRDRLWDAAAELIKGNRLPLDVAAVASRLGLPLAVDDDAAGGPPTPDPDGEDLDRPREVVTLAKPADVTGLPDYRLPQAVDRPAGGYARELTARERRVAFARIESGLDRAERATIDRLEELLEKDRERVHRYLATVLRRGTPAEVVRAIGEIDLAGLPGAAKAWNDLTREVWTLGLDTIRDELSAFADKVPGTIGPNGLALADAYARSAADRVFSEITTTVRFELLNAVTSGATSRAALDAVVATVFEAYETGEGRGPRLTTRMLSSKSLNVARADAIERGGIPLRGAQYSAILDRRTCDLCKRQDEQVIPITHTDLRRFTPPVHHNCRCVWVYITTAELDFTPTWETPPASLVSRFGGLVL